jgi:hypothetical protein
MAALIAIGSEDETTAARPKRLGAVAVLAAAALAAGACGSSSSGGKPSYCQARNDLQQSITDLKGVDVTAQGTDKLKAQLADVADRAKAVAASTKTDFPDQSGAVQSSVDQLKRSVDAISGAPSAQQVVELGTQLAAAGSSVKSLGEATKDACS